MTETLPAPPLPCPQPPRPGGADWVLCRACDAVVYAKRLRRSHSVCPECGRHHPLTAPERLAQLLDEGHEPLPVTVPDSDVLGFVDSQPYPERLRDARRRTGLDEAVLCARGRIDGHPVVVAVMDFRFLGGSLGAAVGEAITRACEVAEAERTPLLLVSASGGARMQEGALALMQMAKTSQALRRLDEAGILTLSLITDPTYGGVAASFATLCDVIVAEPGARLGFAGPRVIAQTIGETLPAGFQTAEYLLEHGIVDLIASRTELRSVLAKLLAVGGGRAAVVRGAGQATADVLVREHAELPERHPWEAVRAARRFGRPTTLDYANLMLHDFIELHGDRMTADCTAMVCGLGRLAGMPVALVGTQKGRTPAELARRNYGMPTPAGYRKAARVMRLAGKLGLPVVTLVDTSGAYPGVAAEEQGQAVAIAENLRLLSGLPVPVVAVVTGEGGSGGALALAVADEVLMCGDAVYSVITPEGCASILWKDAGAAPRAAQALRVDARSLLELGVVDGVIPEAEHGDHAAAAENLGSALIGSLLPLSRMDHPTRIARRHRRFRRFGAPQSGASA